MATSKQLADVLREWADVFMQQSMHQTIRFWKESELSMPQISVMMRLHYHGTCGVSEVGAHVGVTNAAASQMVDKLVQLGLLERAEHPHDRRAKQLTLTRKGHALLQKGMEARRHWLEELGSALTSEQQKAILIALPYLTEAMRQREAQN
jgi:DNA-binding MarR family transcriptional regulator